MLVDHPELASLKSLLAVLSVPRNLDCEKMTTGGSSHEDLSSPQLMMAPASTLWTPGQIEPFLQRIGPSQPVNGIVTYMIEFF